MDIQDLVARAKNGENVITELSDKSVCVPAWRELREQYDPTQHPVMDKNIYPDIVEYEERDSVNEVDEYGMPKRVTVPTGKIEKVTRVTYDLQRLAVKRTTELCFGIPVRRNYRPEVDNDKQKEVAKYLEAIFKRNRIDSVNIDRGRQLYASCEIMTLWYAVESPNNHYGFKSKLKLRCVTYSPMLGDTLYPLFDERGDLVALSVGYTRKVADKFVQNFDTYTADTHLHWSNSSGNNDASSWGEAEVEDIVIGKIPAVYRFRPTPAWDDASPLVYEMEWAVSRNGNYLRENSRPILLATVDEEIQFGKSPSANEASRDIIKYPKGSGLQYVTWNQSIETLRFHVDELRRMFFTQLQLPDWSYENMKTSPMSGEARKQLFIDCHLKVKDESGQWLEFFDREVNVVKAFLKRMLPEDYADAIDSLVVDCEMTPYVISDDKEQVELLLMKNGNKQLISHRESIRQLGESEDADQTYAEITRENVQDALALSL